MSPEVRLASGWQAGVLRPLSQTRTFPSSNLFCFVLKREANLPQNRRSGYQPLPGCGRRAEGWHPQQAAAGGTCDMNAPAPARSC